MNIRKSDMIQFARDIKNNNRPTDEKSGKTDSIPATVLKSAAPVGDQLRGQVRTLQNDLNQLQTQMTFRQAQVAFLQNLHGDGTWDQELRKFMSENFTSVTLTIPESESKSEFTSRTTTEMQQIHNDLLKKEVQLQNIFSTGLAGEPDVNLVKNADEVRSIFARLQPESVDRLLKS
ncbi:MAG: hypothetical protein KDK41_08685 [Leptospiraceae bacterium]|nr:hypothetical protein [Leptospiraceae bacterium]